MNLITMETTIAKQFVILALHPDKGRIIIENIYFRYSLTGAVLMDFLDNGEISLSNNRLVSSFRKNGDPTHDMFAEKIERSSKPRRVSYWVRSLTSKSRFVFREIVNSLINKGIVRHERRLFLNIFPYNRYFITDRSIRNRIIEEIRDILLYDKPASRKQTMLIGIIKASGSYRLLAKEKEERKILRKKCDTFMQKDVMTSEIDRAIREVQAAIIASVTAASVAASSSH
jgi:hypothetical protein